MQKSKKRLSLGSIFAILLSLATTLACIWIFPKLFGKQEDSVQINTTGFSIQNAATIVPAEVLQASSLGQEVSNSDSVKLSFLFSGIVNFNQKVQDATLENDGNYHSAYMFDYVKSMFDAGYTSASIMNTFDTSSSYNDNNSPPELLYSLKQNGMNLLGAGGRNILNKGVVGIDSILENASNYDIPVHGINSKKAELPLHFEDMSGVSVCFLQYTQRIAKTGIYAMNEKSLDRYVAQLSEERVKADIARAKESGAEIIIVNIFWNAEPDPRVSNYQKNAVHMIANAGADLILGSNLTSPQSFELITAFNADGSKRNVPVVYSLGTLLDSDRSKLPRTCSILLHTEITYNTESKQIQSLDFDYTPLFIWREQQDGKERFVILDASLPALTGMSDEQKESLNRVNSLLHETYSNLPIQVNMQ